MEQRWVAQLESFDFEIKYCSDRSNKNADALCRQHPPGAQDMDAMRPGTLLENPLQLVLQPTTSLIVQVTAFPSGDVSGLCALQQADLTLKDILVLLDQKRWSYREKRERLSPIGLALLRQWDRLVKQGGVLYHQVFLSCSTEATLQVLLPAVLKDEILTIKKGT